jgi:hypothetical protein
MSQSSFGEALSRLWPSGDAGIPGLPAGTALGKFLAALVAAFRRKARAARPALHAI